jgi:glycosyltransferase involved in cell wall biosynthesis
MNIGIVTTWFERGAAYVSKAYMKTLSPAHNVFIYARGGEEYGKGDPNWDLPCVTWAPRFQGMACESSTALSMTHFWKWLRDNAIDVIIMNEQRYAVNVKQIADLGYVVGAYVDYYRKKIVPDFETYDFLLCNTKRHYSVFRNHRKCFFIQWGTDINLFKPSLFYPERNPSGTIVFFQSSGWEGKKFRKGTDLLVKAFQGVSGKAMLIIHSQTSAEEYGDIAELIRKDTRIEFIEKTVPAPGLYHMGDVFVYPSKLEGIGLCVPEALACGLPVITTDNAPMNEFVEDGYNGLLVRVARTQQRKDKYYWPETYVDVGDLAAKMQFYVDHPEVIAKHQRNARISAEEKFDWAKNSSYLASDLNEMFGMKKVREPYVTERLRWYGQYVFLVCQKYIFKIANMILPHSVLHFLNTPRRWIIRKNL